jgi:hypothetical protein
MNDKDFKKLFKAHKVDIPDEGFSERVIGQLPERKSWLPQMVMIVFILLGFILVFAIQDITHLLEQITSLTTSINRLQAPSPGAIMTYISLLVMTGTVGYSIMEMTGGRRN